MVTDFLDKERGNHLKWVTNGLGAKQFWSVKNIVFYNTLNGVIIVNVHTCSFFKYYSYTLTILCVCVGGGRYGSVRDDCTPLKCQNTLHSQCSHWGGGAFLKIYEWVSNNLNLVEYLNMI